MTDKTSERFTFKEGELEFALPVKTLDVLTPGFVRLNRRRDETDYFMTVLEQLCGVGLDADRVKELGLTDDQLEDGKSILKAIDRLPWKAHQKLQKEFQAHLGASLGE